MSSQDIFLQAIHQKHLLTVTVNTDTKGIITRECVPFDYGPSKRYKDGIPRYHFYDLNSPEGSHNLAVLPEKLINIQMSNKTFDPADYVTWPGPYTWYVKRDWGQYS